MCCTDAYAALTRRHLRRSARPLSVCLLLQTGATTLAQVQAMLAAQDLKAQGYALPELAPTAPLGPVPQIDEIAFSAQPGQAPESLLQGLLAAVARHGPKMPRW